MKLITSDGVEFNAVTITLNEEPSRFSFRIKDMTIPEASDMFCKGNALPIQNYEDFTEVQSINRSCSGHRLKTEVHMNSNSYATIAKSDIVRMVNVLKRLNVQGYDSMYGLVGTVEFLEGKLMEPEPSEKKEPVDHEFQPLEKVQ